MSPELDGFFASCRDRIAAELENRLPSPGDVLHDAMRYAVLGGGKRIRPILSYAAAMATGGGNADTDSVACAIEFIHAYSLIHDDLPAMDNDDLRRGKPTCHITFGEAMAILAGDALQALAFAQLAALKQVPASTAVQAIGLLAAAAGGRGMVYGQAIDLAATGVKIGAPQLEILHQRKTGDLIRASLALGAMTTGCVDNRALKALHDYGEVIGLAFQIKDDILDLEGDTATLGKRQGADDDLAKSTFVSLLGLAGAKRRLRELHLQGLAALAPLGHRAELLRGIADYIVARDC